MIRHFQPLKWDLEISIEFPDISGQPISASRLIIREVTDPPGDPKRQIITSVNSMSIYCTAGNIIWAELEMYADLDGKPVLRDKPYIKDNTIVLGTLRAKVTEFLSGTSYRQGLKRQHGAVHE